MTQWLSTNGRYWVRLSVPTLIHSEFLNAQYVGGKVTTPSSLSLTTKATNRAACLNRK